MGHKGQALDFILDLGPDLGKCRLSVSIAASEPMDRRSPSGIIVRDGLNQTIKLVNNLTVTDNHNADAAYTGASAICGFKIYCYKVLHR